MTNESISQLNLKEPAQVDWENLGKSSYSPPPPAIGPDLKPIVYFGQVVSAAESKPDVDANGDPYLSFQLDLKFTKSGTVDGKDIRTWVSTRPFMRRDASGELVAVKGNPNSLANFLRSAGLQARPQNNSEYKAAVKMVNGKAIPFTIDWEAKAKDGSEVIRGYSNFPDDPERPGQKKSILKAGDVIVERDKKGNITGTKQVQSEVLFANARIKYFQDPSPKVGRVV